MLIFNKKANTISKKLLHVKRLLTYTQSSFPGAFGLALKVSTPPATAKAGDESDLVRHFLIEPTSKGVKLKGYANEPVFASLSALVYQHTMTQLALPVRLLLPTHDLAMISEGGGSNRDSIDSRISTSSQVCITG